jgi:tungstate transport system substrate-binding protein
LQNGTCQDGGKMKKAVLLSGLAIALISLLPCGCKTSKAAENRPVRVAVIGGMTMTPLWSEVQKLFEADTGIKIEVVATGVKDVLSNAMKEGKADFLTMHSSDATTNLVADGWARDIRPWAKNDLVIVGPVSDPAGISGMKSGADAVKKIAEAQANWLDFQSNGPRETAHTLFTKAKTNMIGPWVLKYENTDSRGILHYVANKNAYMIVGRIPVVFKKWEPDPKVKIMVEGDPAMRRPYMEMVANPEQFPNANIEGARKLSDFLLSDKIQKFLATYDGGVGDGIPIFIPVRYPIPKR